MSPEIEQGEAPDAAHSVSVELIAWLALAAAFIGVRLAIALNVDVAGAELAGLSGAWQAHAGNGDPRWLPTLFQAVAAITFEWTESEIPARLIAFAASATIPLALYLLRGQLGGGGALVALIVLLLDAPSALFGSTASAMGFDLALAAWLAVVFLRRYDAGYGWIGLGLLAALSGPLMLPLLAAAAAVAPAAGTGAGSQWQRYRAPVLFAIGAAAGVGAASTRLGIGDASVVVPPFDLFVESFEAAWLTGTLAEISGLYAIPLLAIGAGAAAALLMLRVRGRSLTHTERLALAWAGFAGAWLVLSFGEHSAAPLAALALPVALLAACVTPLLAAELAAADWRAARFALPSAVALGGLALAPALDWAQRETVGSTDKQFQVWAFSLLALAMLGVLLLNRRTAVTAAVPLLAGAAVLMGAGVFPVVSGAQTEPLVSPVSPVQARDLRAIALERAAAKGGRIVIHPDLEEAATWPFRDSGTIIVASRVPDDAAFVIWPTTAAAPEGYVPVDGNWALTRDLLPPTRDALDALHWLFDRHTLAIRPQPVAVYSRDDE